MLFVQRGKSLLLFFLLSNSNLSLLFFFFLSLSLSLLQFSGQIDVKMAPKAVSLREESELQAMLDRLALEQEEVDGDAPEDD
jgi:hypothetical protein